MAQGMKVCDQCGQQEEHFVELLSQENIGEVERSRLLNTRLHNLENEEATQPSAAGVWCWMLCLSVVNG